MIFRECPSNFESKFEIVSCYIENDGDILILHRQDYKPEGNTWGLPAGKIDKEEDRTTAMLREIEEETGIIKQTNDLEFLDTLYVKYPEYHFIYHMFRMVLKDRPEIRLSDKEHKNYQWSQPASVLKLPLVRDLDSCIKISYFKNKEKVG
ncbi:MAG TPA: NUDIX hydrolase [bacterium]|mgnify:CR=1 FL=1|nr:NUDIX hydrolase [bacterium]HPT30121.1 NUDIX hydrolase [bacterium]